ncbi:glycosyltransferase [Campylobacter sp. IFREMER_LSEM_CL2101]|uniref:glycosyltransferase family 2 protein n=1 Tax=Campylobacter sp. IFREMER_LSEM_CL2101 TaxID=2911618 RepID=UPI0021E7F943|nr:glycosyltransferase [Campylobacter sp. IFREMER_LSEM_CL2101]MCV3391542.1 glycosyltransferase [Campylobacter sp. IFREMER_LSEM_CL2101]
MQDYRVVFYDLFEREEYLKCKDILLKITDNQLLKDIVDLTKNSKNPNVLELFSIAFSRIYTSKSNGNDECLAYINYNLYLAENYLNLSIDEWILNNFEVIIPTYNRKKALLEAICHIKNINKNIHIRVSDNGSTDGTREELKVIEKKYHNLHLHFNEENQGFGKNALKLIEKTDKKYILCISDEDFISGFNLIKALNFMKDNDVDCLRPPHLLIEGKRIGIFSTNTLETKELPLSVITSGFFSGFIYKTDILKKNLSFLQRDDSTLIYPHCAWTFLAMIFGKCFYFSEPLTIEKNLSPGYIGPKFEAKLDIGLSYSHPLERWRIFVAFLCFIRELKSKAIMNHTEREKVEKLELLFQKSSIVLLWNLAKNTFPLLDKKYSGGGEIGFVFKDLSLHSQLENLQNKNKQFQKLNTNLTSEIKQNKLELQQTQSQIAFQTKYGTAKARIQNQLSYKLGQAMVVNSKSIPGYIRMPFVLSYIKDKHKQEQKIYQEKIKKDSSLILPPLESYPDYKEALKEKECLTYKLGEALIQANKTWYKGGYIGLLFKIKRLKKDFKKGAR